MKRLLASSLVLALPCAGLAATIHVPAEQPTIQAGINAATYGDTVLVACGTYYEVNLGTANGVALISELGTPECVTIDGGGLGSVFSTDAADESTLIRGFTVTGGAATDGGGMHLNGWRGVIENCLFTQNEATLGGGVWGLHSPATFVSCDFVSNLATTGGGAFFNSSHGLEFHGCRFFLNIADSHGGGIQLDEANTQFHSCVFSRNVAEWGGGAHVYLAAGHFYDCLFFCNVALATNVGGGGGLRGVGTVLTVSGCTFYGNYAALYGGGLEVSNGTEGVVERTLIVFSTGGGAARRAGDTDILCTCTNMYGNAGGDWGLGFDGFYGVEGNIAANPFLCDPEEDVFTVDGTSPCLPENNDCNVLIGAFGEGCELTSVADPGSLGFSSLEPNVPNPFNPTTRILFTLRKAGTVTLKVYDLSGKLVRTLSDRREYAAGQHSITWDGRNEASSAVPSGAYFCCLEAAGSSAVQKMMLIK